MLRFNSMKNSRLGGNNRMKCKNCGHKLSSTEFKTCPECGEEVNGKPKAKKTKKAIVFSIVCIILLAAFITFYFVGKDKFNPINIVNSFEEAVTNEDHDTLVKLLSAYNNSFDIKTEDVSVLIEFFQSNPDLFRELIEKLTNEANSLSKNTGTSSSNTFGTINLEVNGKKWLFFKDYQLVVIPAFIEVYTESNTVDIVINDETVDTTPDEGFHEETYGPYMPGTYQVKAFFDNSYVSTEQLEEVSLFNMDTKSTRLELDLNVGTIQIVSNFEDEATLLLNDQETDIIINKGSQAIGPLPLNEGIEIQLQKNFPWESVKSEKFTITEDIDKYNIDKVRTVSDTEVENIINIINEVFQNNTEAINERNSSIVQANITDNFIAKLDEQIDEIEKNTPDYEGKLLKAQYRLEWIQDPELNEKTGLYEFDIDVMFTYYEPNGNLGRLFEGENKHEYERGYNVVLIYDEDVKNWLVDRYTFEHFFVYDEDPTYEFD